ncbi:MAG TPA: hypothetical protein DIS62_00965 [Candidatus Kerfeldbacteria bacterium]|nr:hypothetical protein [Candidatus Kerfeldbacteria bacterium]
MNSESLRSRFPEVYKEFFAKCSTVVSAPGSFFWSAGLAVIYGGIGVIEKIPLRVYVGIERDHDTTLRFGDYISYIPHQQQFENFSHNKVYEEKLLQLLDDVCRGLPNTVGGKIHILSEVPRGAGLNQSGASNMGISVLLALESGMTDREHIEKQVSTKTPELQKDPVFDKIFRTSWKLEACAHADVGSGGGTYAAFVASASPILFYSERRQGTFSEHPYARYPSNVEGHYEMFDTIEYAGYRLKDLFGWRGEPVWPIDYGLIYLGQQKHSGIFLGPMRIIKKSLDRLEDFVVEHMKEFPSSSRDVDPAFYFMTQANNHRGFWEKSINFLLILSVKAIDDLKKLVENGTAEALNEFVDTVDLQEQVMKFFTKGITQSDEVGFLSRIRDIISNKATNGLRSIKFLPDRADAGGDLLFVAPQGYLQDHIEEFQTLLRTHVSPLIRIDYMSWIDGIETGGVHVEQNLTMKQFSDFISHGTLHVAEWKSESLPTHRVYSVEAFEESKMHMDLLLDELEHKILVNGRPLTSKDIKSAKATIEILKVLLENLGEDVPAMQLPESAYIERNEMQSKIISPLATSFKRITGKHLPLSLHGGLRKNFAMKLDKSDLTIGVLERKE